MARRRTELNSSQAASGSGTTAKLRQQQAPDPASVQVDGRGDADLIGCVVKLAISPFEAFANHEKIGLNPSAIAAFLAGTAAPQDFSPDLPGVNYLGGSRQLRRRVPPPLSPCDGRGSRQPRGRRYLCQNL